MKKLIALIVTFALFATLGLALADETVAGTWYLSEVVLGESSFVPAALGMTQTLELNEDGTMQSITTFGEETEEQAGQWSQDGDAITVISGDETLVMNCVDGTLVSEAEMGTMVFTREAPTVATPELIQAEQSAFYGHWVLTNVATQGMMLPADAFGLVLEMDITESGLTVTSQGDSFDVTAEYDAGVITFTDENGASSTLQLTDLGWMAMPLPIDDSGELSTLYFEMQ